MSDTRDAPAATAVHGHAGARSPEDELAAGTQARRQAEHALSPRERLELLDALARQIAHVAGVARHPS